MYSNFIVNRPVLTGVISIVIIISGLVTLSALPVDLYPDIVPPTVVVTAVYPGADAQTLADTVATVIEDQVNGVENMIYMSSTSASDGTYTLTVTFDVGTDLDMAQVLVQNRVSIAEPRLPEEVKRQGITTLKRSTNFVMVISLFSPDGQKDDLFLNNYASIHINDVLKRIDGVGDVQIFGKDYCMRIWMDPNQLRTRNLTVEDVTNAIKAQNVQVAAGSIGEPPAPNGQQFQYTVTVMGRLKTEEQFGNIIVKVGDDGQIVRIRDIGRVERGAQNYSSYSQLNGKPAGNIVVYQLPGSNAIDIAKACRATMKDLARDFPDGLDYIVSYDFTDFIRASIHEITITLFQAVGLVVLITFVFLQDWRACLVPTLTVPVSLIGTFLAMKMLGFSVNTLTMFGLVLAIGVVVDDSIVVVENTQRKIDNGMKPKAAAIESLSELVGPCIATSLVLMAVFVPTAFMGGITGRLYKQFALTISASTFFSTVNALTLSPALCSILLRPTAYRNRPTKNPITLVLRVFFKGFNKVFGVVQAGYNKTITVLIRRIIIMALVFLIILALTVMGFMHLPTGFLPEEDQGYFMGVAQLPDASSMQRTSEVLNKINDILNNIDGVSNVISIGGYSLIDSTNTSNQASFICVLENWDKRKDPKLHIDAIMAKAQAEFNKINDARIFAFNPPAIPGLGNAGGLQMQLEDVGRAGVEALQTGVNDLCLLANQNPDLTQTYTMFRANVPQYYVDVDRPKVMASGVDLNSVFDAMQAYMGSLYVNDFNLFGKSYQVRIQAESKYRATPVDIEKLEVRTKTGEMAPIGTFVRLEERVGPQVINRYNMYESALVMSTPAPGHSSGQGMKAMGEIVDTKLPRNFDYQWTGISYQQKVAEGQAPFIFALGAIFVYLFLAAQYESFLLPISVMLSIPFALLGAVAATGLREYDNNIYTQIGIIILIGLASKTSILIVEFAKTKHEDEGLNRADAAIEAGKLRFRAILMTAFSDIFGWTPLVIALGAGSSSRKALGTAVFGGMIAATVIGLLFVPALYVMVQIVGDYMDKRRKENEEKIKQELSGSSE